MLKADAVSPFNSVLLLAWIAGKSFALSYTGNTWIPLPWVAFKSWPVIHLSFKLLFLFRSILSWLLFSISCSISFILIDIVVRFIALKTCIGHLNLFKCKFSNLHTEKVIALLMCFHTYPHLLKTCILFTISKQYFCAVKWVHITVSFVMVNPSLAGNQPLDKLGYCQQRDGDPFWDKQSLQKQK